MSNGLPEGLLAHLRTTQIDFSDQIIPFIINLNERILLGQIHEYICKVKKTLQF